MSNFPVIYCFKPLSWQIVDRCIRDLELSLTDTQPGAVWGVAGEMLSCPRLDNQVRDNRFCNLYTCTVLYCQSHCYTGLRALLDHADTSLAEAGRIYLLKLIERRRLEQKVALKMTYLLVIFMSD